MKKINKFASLALSLVMVMGLSVPAFATELTSDNLASDKLDTTAGTFDGVKYNEYTAVAVDGVIKPGEASSVVVVDAEATNFSVTAPILLHVNMDAEGVITTPDSMDATSMGIAKIKNNCVLGQVKMVSAEIVNAPNWALTAFDADYANMLVNSKNYGFKINGINVGTDGAIIANNAVSDTITSTYDITKGIADKEEFGDYTFTRTGSSAFPVIANGSCMPIEYSAKLPAMSAAVVNTIVGGVVFTFDFN